MGYIKEPDGVDFVIQGKPLTEKQKQAISEFIKEDKEKRKREGLRKKKGAVKPKNASLQEYIQALGFSILSMCLIDNLFSELIVTFKEGWKLKEKKIGI